MNFLTLKWMGKLKQFTILFAILYVSEMAHAQFRIVISSDFPPLDVCMSGCAADHISDPDDIQSMVRFLLYANEFEVEGLIASSATFANIANKQNILNIIGLYAKVYDNLKAHDSKYPTPEYLRSVTYQGRSGTYSGTVANNIGAGKDSQASDAIISIVDKPDTRPIWFCIWGDCSNLAQAIWKVQNTRTDAELHKFLSKIRIYQIAHQDDTIDWLMSNFPNLFIIYSQNTWQGIYGGPNNPLGNLAWLNANIRQNHGPLGAIYPPAAMGVDGMKEGDSPSFMYLVSAAKGLNNPEFPGQPGWGGQYVRSGSTNHWVDGPGTSSIRKWESQYQTDFAQRADWMVESFPTETTGIKDNPNNTVSLYPNPVTNELKITSVNGFDALKIFSLGGNLVLEKRFPGKIKTTTLQLNLSKGTYLMKLDNRADSLKFFVD